MSGGLTENQLMAMVITERFNSCLSLLGIFFILSTYLFSPYFDKPINRLIFFATWANLGANVASLISQAGPLAGQNTPLCQIQAFLVQMFLGVDCYWAFCMAINVYLVFFHDFTIDQLRSLDVRYLLACYGASFVPALVLLFIQTESRGRAYGDAVIWCWIDIEWDYLRVVLLYGIVWIAMVFAMVVYVMAGKVIYDRRKHLDGYLNPLNDYPFANTVTRTQEIHVTHEDRPEYRRDSSEPITAADRSDSRAADEIDAYTFQVEAPQLANNQRLPAALRLRSLTRDAAQEAPNVEAWLYARVAFLFFAALLITWVPSSINRIYALVHPEVVNFPLNYISSFVFPLQGFWNVIVYVITSQTATRRLYGDVRAFFSHGRRSGNDIPFESKYGSDGNGGGSRGRGRGLGHNVAGPSKQRPMWGARQQKMDTWSSFS